MWRNKKIMDHRESICLLTVWVNALLIAVAVIYHPEFFWLLLISIPLSLACIIYITHAKRFNRSVGHCQPWDIIQAKNEEWCPSIAYNASKEKDLKIIIGNSQCSQPYSVSIFSICSTIDNLPTYGQSRPLADRKADAENRCRKSMNTYHLAGENLVLQVRKGEAIAEREHGSFNSRHFQEAACRPEVKLIEVLFTNNKASGPPLTSTSEGFLPYSQTYAIDPVTSNVSSAEAEGWMHFLGSLRALSGQKPIGIRLSINDKSKMHQVCFAIRKTMLIPDFIVVEDGSERVSHRYKTTNMQPSLPLYEALEFILQTLRSYGLEKQIQVIAVAEIRSAFDLLKLLALGAHAAWSEPSRYQLYDGKVVEWQHMIISATRQAMEVCGCSQVSEITLPKFFRRLDVLHTKGNEQSNDQVTYPGIIRRIYDAPLSTMYTGPVQSAGR